MKWLHKKGEFSPSMIADDEPMELVNDINRVLTQGANKGFADGVMSEAMRHKLENSVFLFSGFKTMHELTDASNLLRDDKGNIKPFGAFLQDVRAIDDSYNKNYLRAEYEFAVSSAQAASRWADSEEDTTLQYRTAGDGKVRKTHIELNGITLPKSDKFWDSYYPPNGWGCRCTAIEVNDDTHESSDSKEAQKAGDKAIASQGKKGNIFKFNAGKQGQIFPPKHPYFCRKRDSCNKVTLAADISQSALCSGCAKLCQIINKGDK